MVFALWSSIISAKPLKRGTGKNEPSPVSNKLYGMEIMNCSTIVARQYPILAVVAPLTTSAQIKPLVDFGSRSLMIPFVMTNKAVLESSHFPCLTTSAQISVYEPWSVLRIYGLEEWSIFTKEKEQPFPPIKPLFFNCCLIPTFLLAYLSLCYML